MTQASFRTAGLLTARATLVREVTGSIPSPCPLPQWGRGMGAKTTWERDERDGGSDGPGHAGAFQQRVVNAPW
jgi:hypothetical protein